MDKYHIYEEIGKGEFSQVFKGREKKKIEYVAIKRVEKSMMNKIVNEVQIMHKLDSPHVLRFYDWYETRNNLWLILEYCTGADLESLLKQDGYLPELSVRMFGLDMLAGLKYMHCLGLLHCDIRPKNFLIDEYGILKLSDFKFARKIPKAPLGEAVLEQRGVPSYMAPELFSPDGLHSFSSDFWALGCSLYELRRGGPPFGNGDTSIEELIDHIRTVEPVEAPIVQQQPPASASKADREKKDRQPPPSFSAEFADLLLWCLEKAPMNRCSWANLATHPFWDEDANDAPANLPAQPAYDNLITKLEKARSSKIEASSLAEVGLTVADVIMLQAHEAAVGGGGPRLLQPPTVGSTPVRPVTDGVGPTGTVAGGGQAQQGGGGGGGGAKGGHPIAADAKPAAMVGIGSKQTSGSSLQQRNRQHPQQQPQQQDGPQQPAAASATDESQQREQDPGIEHMVAYAAGAIGVSTSGSAVMTTSAAASASASSSAGAKRTASAGAGGANGVRSVNGTPNAAGTPSEAALARSSSSRTTAKQQEQQHEQQQHEEYNALRSSFSSFSASNGAGAVPSQRTQDGAATAGAGLAQQRMGLLAIGPAVGGVDSGIAPELAVKTLILHPSDTQVKPIVGNKAIEVIEKAVFRPASLQPLFSVLGPEDLLRLPEAALDAHLTAVYKAMARAMATPASPAGGSAPSSGGAPSNAQLADRANILGYLISVSSVAEVANTVLNTHFLGLLLRCLKPAPPGLSTSSSSARPQGHAQASASPAPPSAAATYTHCRALSATALALMLRYATFIAPPSARLREEHILPTLTTLLREGGPNVFGYGSGAASAAGVGGGTTAAAVAGQKLDPKLKRRAAAALGELVFYIAAQEEEPGGESGGGGDGEQGAAGAADGGQDKWVLPAAAISVLVRCLRDEADECVRHYAAKAIENSLAQGGLDYRRRFATVDIAGRLLEMSLHSRNDVLQATCGMALAHICHLVMTAAPASASGPSAAAQQKKQATAAAAAPHTPSRGSEGSPSSTSPFREEGLNQPGAGGRFVARVLEKGGLAGIIEVLRDGPPKLQQAYLIVLSVVFCSSFSPNTGSAEATAQNTAAAAAAAGPEFDPTEDTAGSIEFDSPVSALNADARALQTTRQLFLRAPGLLPALQCLTEQGGTATVRAKALLALQLLSRHDPSLLSSFAERRLPGVLMKALDPLVSQHVADLEESATVVGPVVPSAAGAAGGGAKTVNITYPVKSALSMIVFVREMGVKCVLLLARELSRSEAYASAEHAVPLLHSVVAQGQGQGHTHGQSAGLYRDDSGADGADSGARGGGGGGGSGGLQLQYTPMRGAAPGDGDANGFQTASKSSAKSGRTTPATLVRQTPLSTQGSLWTPQSSTRERSRSQASATGTEESATAGRDFDDATDEDAYSGVTSRGNHQRAHAEGQRAGSIFGAGQGVGSGGSGSVAVPDIAALFRAADFLRAVASIISPHPTLRRLVLSWGPMFIAATAQALDLIPGSQAAVLAQLQRLQQQQRQQCVEQDRESAVGEAIRSVELLLEATREAEHGLLAALESLCLLDSVEGLRPNTGAGAGFDTAGSEAAQQKLPEYVGTVVPDNGKRLQAAGAMCVLLIPSACKLLQHSDGGMRVGSLACLRRLLPGQLRSLMALQGNTAIFGIDERSKDPLNYVAFPRLVGAISTSEAAGESVGTTNAGANPSIGVDFLRAIGRPSRCLLPLLSRASALLTDRPPIPQYITRLLLEFVTLGQGSAAGGGGGGGGGGRSTGLVQVAADVAGELHRTGGLHVLIQLLKSAGNHSSQAGSLGRSPSDAQGPGGVDLDDGAESVADPQLVILLRTIFERSQSWGDAGVVDSQRDRAEASPAVGAAGAASAPAGAPAAGTIGTLPVAMLEADTAGAVSLALSSLTRVGAHVSKEMVLSLLELLQSVLTYAMRAFATAASAHSQQAAPYASPSGGKRIAGASSVKTGALASDAIRKLVAPCRAACAPLFLLLTAFPSVASAGTGGGGSSSLHILGRPLTQREWDEQLSAAQQLSGYSRHQSMQLQDAYSSPAATAADGDYRGDTTGRRDLMRTPGGGQETSEGAQVVHGMRDGVSRCIGMLFDIFPDAVTAHLLMDKSSDAAIEIPRSVIANILLLPQVELRLRTRLMKILAGVVKMAPQMGVSGRVKEFIQSHGLKTAISKYASLAGERRQESLVEQALSAQLLHLGEPEKNLVSNICLLAQQLLDSADGL